MGNNLNTKVPLIYEKDLTDLNLGVSCDGYQDDSRTVDLSKYTDTSNLFAVCISTHSRGYFSGGRDFDEWIETTNPVITIESKGGYIISNNIARPYCARTQLIKRIRLKSK